MYAPNTGTASYIRQTLGSLENLISNTTILTGDLNTPLSEKDRSSRQKISKEVAELNHNLKQLELVDIYRVFHPGTSEYTFFSAAHGIFSKIDHILVHRSCLSICRKTEIIPCILSDHSAMKLEINDKRNYKNSRNTWKLNNILLSNQWVTDEIKQEMKQFL